MATIRTAIELQDNFTGVMYQVINSVNLGVSAMEDLHQAMNFPVDTTSMEAVKDSINQTTFAVQQLAAAMQELKNTAAGMPTAPQNSAPLEQPVHWQPDDLDVFTDTGVEHFEQEVQSANTMLRGLNQTQMQIAETAARTELLPESTVVDRGNLPAIQQRIQTIENPPMNIGSDVANERLEQLREQLNQALQEQNELNLAMCKMDITNINVAYLNMSQTISETEQYISNNVEEQEQLNSKIEEGTQKANGLMDKIKGVINQYATIENLGSVLQLSDDLVQTEARLNMINDGAQTTDELFNMVYASAQNARGSLQEMVNVVAQFGSNAGDAFGSTAEVVGFAELVQKQMTIAGVGTQEASNAMLQLSQALGSGVISGDQLNSIFGQAPNLIQNIADYLGVGTNEIQEMAAEGGIAADIVKSAIFASADEINARFEEMPMTWGQIWQSFQNTAFMAFQPVLQRINEIANSEAFQGFVNGVIGALSVVADMALEAFDFLAGIASTIVDNWSAIAPVITPIATAVAILAGALLIYEAVSGLATAAQWLFNTSLLGCPLVWILVIIIAVIAAIFFVIDIINKVTGSSISAIGVIMGALATAGAFVWDLFLGILELVLGIINYMVNPIIAFVNFFGNVFNDPIGSIIHLFGDLADNVLGVIQKIASALDFVFGSNMADTVQGWRNSLSDMVDTKAKEYGNGQYEEITSALDLSVEDLGLSRIAYSDAWDAGYNFGESIESFDPSSLMPSPDAASLMPAPDTASFMPAPDTANFTDDVSDIAGNTEAIKDTMDITEEDLKYLRDIAEQEAINRFTTAEIIIEQTNHNNVSGRMDLDGVVSGLTDAVNEAVDIITEGVHA